MEAYLQNLVHVRTDRVSGLEKALSNLFDLEVAFFDLLGVVGELFLHFLNETVDFGL